jgi:hypothetical protein
MFHCNMDSTMIRRHPPQITPRLEFLPHPLPPLPQITPRMEFPGERRPYRSRTRSRTRSLSPNSIELDTLSSAQDSDDEEDRQLTNKIPKPPGEAGRPASGGFNLEEALGWPKGTYQKILVSYLIMRAIASSYLETKEIHSRSSTKQT